MYHSSFLIVFRNCWICGFHLQIIFLFMAQFHFFPKMTYNFYLFPFFFWNRHMMIFHGFLLKGHWQVVGESSHHPSCAFYPATPDMRVLVHKLNVPLQASVEMPADSIWLLSRMVELVFLQDMRIDSQCTVFNTNEKGFILTYWQNKASSAVVIGE